MTPEDLFHGDLLKVLFKVRDLLQLQLDAMKEAQAESKAAREQAMALGKQALDASLSQARCADCGGPLDASDRIHRHDPSGTGA